MTVIIFLVDTSGSMNQKTHNGAKSTLLDLAKETVEKFIKASLVSGGFKGVPRNGDIRLNAAAVHALHCSATFFE